MHLQLGFADLARGGREQRRRVDVAGWERLGEQRTSRQQRQRGNERSHNEFPLRRLFLLGGAAFFRAPVPGEDQEQARPSGSIKSRPLARFAPFFAR